MKSVETEEAYKNTMLWSKRPSEQPCGRLMYHATQFTFNQRDSLFFSLCVFAYYTNMLRFFNVHGRLFFQQSEDLDHPQVLKYTNWKSYGKGKQDGAISRFSFITLRLSRLELEKAWCNGLLDISCVNSLLWRWGRPTKAMNQD